jgi:8-hydroxy-5-deazaflavin:NADPH oxidoreductase
MNIAIIGAGNVGGGLAGAAVRAGHDVVVSASDPRSAQAAAGRTGARAALGSSDAVQAADVVVLAVPHAAVAGVVGELGDALTGKVVVDATNPLDETFSDLTTSGVSAGEELQRLVPGATVVKALNTVFASRYADPVEDGQPLDAFVAGDDDAAKQTVGSLVESLGFRPVDVGSLRMARTLEELAFANISLNATRGWTWQSAFRLVGPQAAA